MTEIRNQYNNNNHDFNTLQIVYFANCFPLLQMLTANAVPMLVTNL